MAYVQFHLFILCQSNATAEQCEWCRCSTAHKLSLNFSVFVLSREASSGQRSADYVVGQVSGSLFQKKSSSSRSLSALFSSPAAATPLLFKPAPLVNPPHTHSLPLSRVGAAADSAQLSRHQSSANSLLDVLDVAETTVFHQ